MKRPVSLTTFYIRLLSYANALKVIASIDSFSKYSKHVDEVTDLDEANITVGGVAIHVSVEGLDHTMNFLESLKVPYELSGQHPTNTHQDIINKYKNNKP